MFEKFHPLHLKIEKRDNLLKTYVNQEFIFFEGFEIFMSFIHSVLKPLGVSIYDRRTHKDFCRAKRHGKLSVV